ncbi:MAG: phosphoribosylamine--glycine ligase [Ignavibacteria bacterium]|jgi:phosphoribosylamine--glycine ligase
MKILVLGNGGREHAIIWKLKQSKLVDKIYCTIGNAGINSIAETIEIKPDNISALIHFVKSTEIDFTVVGPEAPLALGIVDEFVKEGLKVFGPSRNAAQLETSKVFAKIFLKRYHIPTAKFVNFRCEEKNEALSYLDSVDLPIVIKADGLAAGKGVLICDDLKSARDAVSEIFESKIFGSAGNEIVIEEFLTGQEASVFAVCDGNDYIVLPPAQDHKKILDGEKGKNTGGMGSFAPANKIVTSKVMSKVRSRIIEPVLQNMKKEGYEFKGCLYCGLMIDKKLDPYVIEFNVRFGDPESQVVLPLLKSDLLQLLMASSDGDIKKYKPEIYHKYFCCVVLASKGYPDNYEIGKEITGIEKADKDCLVFHAGTKESPDGKIISSGGRVLNVVGESDNGLLEAINNAYKNVDIINFENKYYRTDIGQKGLKEGA